MPGRVIQPPTWLSPADETLLVPHDRDPPPLPLPQYLYETFVQNLQFAYPCFRASLPFGPSHLDLPAQIAARLHAHCDHPLFGEVRPCVVGIGNYLFDAFNNLQHRLDALNSFSESTIHHILAMCGLRPVHRLVTVSNGQEYFQMFLAILDALCLMDLLFDLLNNANLEPSVCRRARLRGWVRLPYVGLSAGEAAKYTKEDLADPCILSAAIVQHRTSPNLPLPVPSGFTIDPSLLNNRRISALFEGRRDRQTINHPAAKIGALGARLDAYTVYKPVCLPHRCLLAFSRR